MYKEAETRFFDEIIDDDGKAVAYTAEVGPVITHNELSQVNREQARLDGDRLKQAAAKKAENEEIDKIIANLRRQK